MTANLSEIPAHALAAPVPLTRPRIGIVGCGKVGGLHRDRLLGEPVDIVAICDPDADALSRMASSLPKRPRLFRSELDLIGAGIVDAVVLCTPHGVHGAQIRTSLEAGVHVLCEKPFVTESDLAAELVHMARERNLALFVAYTRRSRGHARFLLEAAGRIGPLKHVIITRAQPWYQMHRRTWRMREDEGGGFLLDAGASMIDMLLRFVPVPVLAVDAELSRPPGVGSLDVDVRSAIRFEFTDGTRADMVLVGDAPEEVEHIQLFGERGSAGWHFREEAPYDLYVRLADPEGVPGEGVSEAADPVEYRSLSPDAAFVAALCSGRSFGPDSGHDLYDASSAVPVVDMVERIYRDAVWR